MAEIRRLSKNDLDDSIALSQFAFQFELTAEQIEERKTRVKPEQTWGYFVEDQLASKMTILPFHTFIQGKWLKMGGIAGVATWPEQRRGGMVAQLLTHGLKVMKEEGQTVSFLAPFSYPFYRKYGWEMHGEYKKYTIELQQLPSFSKGTSSIRRVEKNIPLLNEVYEKYAVQYNGMLQRDEDWWTHTVFKSKKGNIVVCYNDQNEARGYMIYDVKESEMKVHEMIYLDHDCQKDLWSFIKNHDSMLEKVTVTAPIDDTLPFLLHDPRIKQEIIPYFMGRIVDVVSFLEQYSITQLPSDSLLLHVTDETAPWNNGTWKIEQDVNGNLKVSADQDAVSMGEDKASNEGIACDIQTLSTMLLGYQSPLLLHKIGRLTGRQEVVELWENMITKRSTYLIDFF